jgi:hypothetical protein
LHDQVAVELGEIAQQHKKNAGTLLKTLSKPFGAATTLEHKARHSAKAAVINLQYSW